MKDRYPKKIILKDESEILIRPMIPDDEASLFDFYSTLDEDERNYCKEDVTNPAVVRNIINQSEQDHLYILLGFDGTKVVSLACLEREKHSWSQHVGEIRLIVNEKYRKKGLGSALAKEIYLLAVHAKIEKVMAHMREDQANAIKVFQQLGFSQEARFEDHVKDSQGQKHNLVVMVQNIKGIWQILEDHYKETFHVTGY